MVCSVTHLAHLYKDCFIKRYLTRGKRKRSCVYDKEAFAISSRHKKNLRLRSLCQALPVKRNATPSVLQYILRFKKKKILFYKTERSINERNKQAIKEKG